MGLSSHEGDTPARGHTAIVASTCRSVFTASPAFTVNLPEAVPPRLSILDEAGVVVDAPLVASSPDTDRLTASQGVDDPQHVPRFVGWAGVRRKPTLLPT
ncbi:hypothetical protein BH20CHL6_BH20CHL6_07680 [soil metagenome]